MAQQIVQEECPGLAPASLLLGASRLYLFAMCHRSTSRMITLVGRCGSEMGRATLLQSFAFLPLTSRLYSCRYRFISVQQGLFHVIATVAAETYRPRAVKATGLPTYYCTTTVNIFQYVQHAQSRNAPVRRAELASACRERTKMERPDDGENGRLQTVKKDTPVQQRKAANLFNRACAHTAFAV